MGCLIRLILVGLGLVLLAVLALGLNIAAGLGLIPGLAPRVAEAPAPADPAALRQTEEKISEATAAERFDMELSQAEVNLLLAKYVGSDGRVRNPRARLGRQSIEFEGEIQGVVPVPVGGAVSVALVDGQAKLEIQRLQVGAFGLPGAAQGLAAPMVDQVLNINRVLGEGREVVLERLDVTPERVSVAGERRAEIKVAPGAAGPGGAPPPLTRQVPDGRVARADGSAVVIVAGDSLAASVGATRPELGFASRFHRYLEEKEGGTLGLENLGVPGETSGTFASGGQAARLRTLLTRLKDDNNPATKPAAVLISLGANDVNRALVSQPCQQDPAGQGCQSRIDEGLQRLGTQLPPLLDQVKQAAGADAKLMVLLYYNPFNLGTGLPFEAQSERTTERLNQIVG
ncbi:MAG: SGNH/GDSL hydrolase family protein, partial [Chloroflexi bacterium]|nr:SGNH/GDSL hydrolase family protein [Chloroflexota bacterium]